VMMARFSPRCSISLGRAFKYGSYEVADALMTLGPMLEPHDSLVLLNPPIAIVEDAWGVRVAYIDTGVNYLFQSIGTRLARGDEGRALGWDHLDTSFLESEPVKGEH